MNDHDRESYRAADWRYLSSLARRETISAVVAIATACAYLLWMMYG